MADRRVEFRPPWPAGRVAAAARPVEDVLRQVFRRRGSLYASLAALALGVAFAGPSDVISRADEARSNRVTLAGNPDTGSDALGHREAALESPTAETGPKATPSPTGPSRLAPTRVTPTPSKPTPTTPAPLVTRMEPTPDVPEEYGVHIVRDGESLYMIAHRYGLTARELARLNATTLGAVLLAGRELRVPIESALNARADEPALLDPNHAPHDGNADSSGSSGTDIGGADEVGASDIPATYTVAAGDTLFGISRRFDVQVDDLRRWNGLPPDGSIRAGETLVLSPSRDPQRNEPPPANENLVRYTVLAGDTLSAIARRFGTTVEAIREANGLAGDQIRESQVLLVPRGTVSSQPPSSGRRYGGGKRIEIDLSEQRMYAYDGDVLRWHFVVSTGMSSHPTRRGVFAVQSKIPNAWSSPWQLWMPHWLGIYWAGASENGIHALPIINGRRLWAGLLGTPISYGCVVLGTSEAEMLYRWADMGTPVIIRD